MRNRRGFFRNTRGIIAVEFALLTPFMMAAMFGSFTATRLVRASIKTWNVAQSIGDLVAQQSTVTSARISDFCTGGTLTLAPFTGSLLVTIASVTTSATGTRTVDWQDTTCGNAAPMANASSLGTAYTPNPKDSVIIVMARYTYAFPASYVLPPSMVFTRYTYSRPRSGTQVSHG